MKNIYKILFLSLFVFISSCDDTDERFEGADLDSGWIEVTQTSETTGATDKSVNVPVNITASNFSSFTVDYTVTPVSGNVSNYVSVGNASYTVNPAAGSNQRIFNIELLLENMEPLRAEETVFDVTVTGSSNPNIAIGVSDGSRNLTKRITIPCNEPELASQLLDANPDYLVGEFELLDGDTSGLIPFFTVGQDADGNPVGQTVTLFPGLNPNERVFDAIIYPGFGFQRIVTVTLEIIDFNGEIIVNLQSDIDDTIFLSCAGMTEINMESYIPNAEDEEQAGLSYSPNYLCNGGPTSFSVNYFENRGDCGGTNQFSTFILR